MVASIARGDNSIVDYRRGGRSDRARNHPSQIGALGLWLEGRKVVSYATGMNRQTRPPTSFSKVSVKSRTVIPREVRERLGLKPGDTLRYRLTDKGGVARQGTGE
jgi:AbrB family looped-hinge helix DNA binding protein